MMVSGINNAIKWLAGQRPGHSGVVEVDRLIGNWTYQPSRPDYISVFRRLGLAKNKHPAPESATIKPAHYHKRWAVYFIYSPDGSLTPAHYFTMERLAISGAKLLVVFCSPSRKKIPPDLFSMTDALYWKALPGFDFSGYAIALHELAFHSPGCDILIMNDSVYGPFCSLDDLWPMMAWDLTGFTASSSIENHIQSYAFMLKDWSGKKMHNLSGIFSRLTCFNSYENVVFCQETRLARVASKTMTVGALWYAEHIVCLDAPVYAALSLAENNFPLIKRSLFTKHAHVNDADAVRSVLARHGHPLP